MTTRFRHASSSNDCTALIDGRFAAYLRERGLARRTVKDAHWAIRRAIRFLAARNRDLDSLRLEQFQDFVRESKTSFRSQTSHGHYATALRHYFRFRHGESDLLCDPRGTRRRTDYLWYHWAADYVVFLESHRGFSACSCRANRYVVCDFMRWQFGARDADWRRVSHEDVWRYAREFGRGRKPGTLNQELSRLRKFFEFVLMRGACSPELVHAVPRFANFAQAPQCEVLNDAQRRQLLACFERSSFEGLRDYAMSLCMVDLGLRPLEVVRLDYGDFDMKRATLDIAPTKTDWGRGLPVPSHVLASLRAYLGRRPQSSTCTRLFIHREASGRHVPVKTSTLCQIVNRAYQRCGFSWKKGGGYHLRHTFATRLFARGAELKHIADLMGHRHLQTTIGYTRVDINALRALAFPWPK